MNPLTQQFVHSVANEALSTPSDTSLIDSMVRDAERYRWLRGWLNDPKSPTYDEMLEEISTTDELDAAIDAAIQEGKK